MKFLIGLMLVVLGGTAYAQAGQITATACHFVITADQARLFNAPLPHISQQIGILPQGEVYPVVKFETQTPTYDSGVLIEVDQGFEAWITVDRGHTEGNCDSIPVDTILMIDYPTVCTFTTLTKPSETYAVIGYENGQYLLWQGHAKSMWLRSDQGTLGGACTDSAEATALENARLWSAPDVTEGRFTASLALNSPVTIIAGPVRGYIRYDGSAIGDWYRVSDANGAIGWVWSERLKFD